ncbi:hypothetical protein CORC01_04795 [Colletotrichum orchidophilum]|uniref:Uncharacterized protein n=1 Tax=Colletotrichum orchidophilum TaxID=1209926 RepID=A0A1G4BEM6_9PEZI|nr:uncharacterized protein CORC01_04795 [Colletotrichum orchidophilum]OHE99894.1 hypothetical protein CORC01_04795 [Colletotrichum orchidophilum]
MRALSSVGVGGGGSDTSNTSRRSNNTPSGCDNLSTAPPAPSPSPSPRHAGDPLTSPPPKSIQAHTPARPQQGKPHPSHQQHQKHLVVKQGKQPPPDSSRPRRNIRPSITPATRINPAASAHRTSSNPSRPPGTTTASSRPSAVPSGSSGASAGPTSATSSPAAVAVDRKPVAAQLRTTNNPTSTTNTNPAAVDPSPTPTAATAAAAPTTTTTTTTTTRQPRPLTAAATGPPTTNGPRRITAAATSTSTTTTTKTSTTTAGPNTTSSPSPPTTTTTTTSSTPTTTPLPPHSTPTSTPSSTSRRRPPTLSSSLRTPLHTRDQNVLNPSRPANAARAKPSPTPSPTGTSSAYASAPSTPTMPPYEKGGSTTARQPAMPSLSAKAISRTPLTPKVAAKPSPPVVTPMGRRRNDNTSNNINHPTLPHTNGAVVRDDLTSPAPFLAASNVTPRTGSRQSRVNSANTTPNGTPDPDRNEWERQPTLEPPRRQVVTFSPPSSVSSRNDANDSKFFYASEAKPSQPSQPKVQPLKAQPRPQALQQRGSTFMYANGGAVEKNRPTSPGIGFTPVLAPSLAPSLSPPLAPTPEPPSSKFFYANGAPNLQPGFRPSSAASMTGSVTSGSSKLHRISAGSANGFPLAQRPLSPNKPAQPPTSAPLVKSNSMPPQTVGRAQMTSPPPLAPPSHKRRTSTDTLSQVASYAGSEAPATDAMIMSRFMASQSSTPSELPSPTVPSFFAQQPITIASILQAADDLEEEEEDSADESDDLEDLHSPTKSSHGDPLNDMVLNARRERKVQDLEITNASLEAINRSLEKQLRKQTAELRRYKRLSRSGRISIPPSGGSSRMTSVESTPAGLGIEGLDLSDLSEEEAEEEMDDSMFESSEFSETDSMSISSPKQDPERDLRRRTRDEKRLRLDLSKHRELLVDSQKINVSIKRCLNWTEELIKEGKKALEYSVRPSDVELPPRVLRPAYLEENEDWERGQKDEFTTSLPSSPLDSPRSLSPHWSKPQDRDSGIELPPDEASKRYNTIT